MRTKYLLSLLLTVVCLSVSAQQYKQDYVITSRDGGRDLPKVRMVYGVMAGSNISMLKESDDLLDISNRAGFEIGGMWGFDFGKFEIVPELWYIHNTADIAAENNDSYSLSVNSFELPIVCAIKIGQYLRFNVGPSFSLMSDASLDTPDGDSEEFGQLKSTTGYVIGVSATVWDHLIIDARFTGHFAAKKQEWYEGSAAYEYKYRSFGLNVGYRF